MRPETLLILGCLGFGTVVACAWWIATEILWGGRRS
jgi:uncharacterized membrane protein YtjA (UPF0391 family)